MDRKYQTVIFAALLHDLGKFLQRGDPSGSLRITGKHPEVSRRFIQAKSSIFEPATDIPLLLELVQRHHESPTFPEELRVQGASPEVRPLAMLISTADNYSSAEREDSELRGRNFRTVPLSSVFARLQLQALLPTPRAYRLQPLDPLHAFPEDFRELGEGEMNSQLRRFGEEFLNLETTVDRQNEEVLYTHLMALLQRWTWCIPSDTQEEVPDVSLYDHLRTTSAIAACLYRFHQVGDDFREDSIRDGERSKFRLVVGDLSGIQRYLFQISRIGAGGVAKRLRARSLLLSALTEAISHQLVQRFSLPISCILMASGGKFYVLVPNIEGSEEAVVEIAAQTNRAFLERFQGQLSLNLAQVAFSGRAFSSFGDVFQACAQKLAKQKLAPLHDVLSENGAWLSESFRIPEEMGDAEGICQCCHARKGEEDEKGVRICSSCRDDARMGGILANARYLAFHHGATPFAYRDVAFALTGDVQLTVWREPPPSSLPAYLVVQLNDSKLEGVPQHPALFRYVTNFIPLAHGDERVDCIGCEEECPLPGNPLYFDCLANRAGGRKYLGYLKADVDRLGSLFAWGLRGDDKDRSSVSRIATLSRMLDLFFSGWVEQLLRTRFSYCYAVYSGGDDLFLIGPWDEITGFAEYIQKEFHRFSNDNANLTLSAGIALAKARTPLSRAVALADEALEEAKETPTIGAQTSRDQLVFLGSTFKWRDALPALETGRKLADWLKQEKINSGQVRRLLTYGQMATRYHLRKEARALRYIPLLVYDLRRNMKLPEGDPARLWLEELVRIDNPQALRLEFLAKFAILAKR
ncbi:MAG: type III-A CRISPR-associated protein Cas10/Csm1 [Coprothermobacterota bacterium]|nr:type III-A CRISPR-associated protein Cas10/Csm1 [Coprothermobacterota bacterium]